jgi:hypothetical protein
MMSFFTGYQLSAMSLRMRGAALAGAVLCLLSFQTSAQTSPLSVTKTAGSTKVTCKYTTSGVSVSTSRVASATGTIDCWVPSGSPGAGTVVRPSNTSFLMRMYRNDARFSGNSLSLTEVGPARPQMRYTVNETPGACTKGVSYSWRAVLVASFNAKLDYNGVTVNFPEVAVGGPTASWVAASTNCNR